MRLDLFLKASRLVLRRTVARAMCDIGQIRVNGLPAKASKEIKTGDEIQINKSNRSIVVKVDKIPTVKQTSRHQAQDLIQIVSSVSAPEGPIY